MPRKKVYESDDPKQRRLDAVNTYKGKNNLKRVAIDMPVNKIADIKTFASDHGMSMVQLFTKSIDLYMEHYEEIESSFSKRDGDISK